MDSPFNNNFFKNLKGYINQKYKLIGFDYQRRGDVLTSVTDDILTIKILCKCCINCKPCNCDGIMNFMNQLGSKYDWYIETQKISANGYFEYHQFKIYIKK